jgi:hypothetical protein
MDELKIKMQGEPEVELDEWGFSDADYRALGQHIRAGKSLRSFVDQKLGGRLAILEAEERQKAVAQRVIDRMSADEYQKQHFSLTDFTPRARQQWESAFTALRQARPEFLDSEENRGEIIELIWGDWNLPPSVSTMLEAFRILKEAGRLSLDDSRGTFFHSGTMLRVG